MISNNAKLKFWKGDMCMCVFVLCVQTCMCVFGEISVEVLNDQNGKSEQEVAN